MNPWLVAAILVTWVAGCAVPTSQSGPALTITTYACASPDLCEEFKNDTGSPIEIAIVRSSGLGKPITITVPAKGVAQVDIQQP